jgi:glycyl-tRNA synthetase beta chain
MLVDKSRLCRSTVCWRSGAVLFDKITDASPALVDFTHTGLAGSLREQGYTAQEVDAVLALRPQQLGDVPQAPGCRSAFAALPEAPVSGRCQQRSATS